MAIFQNFSDASSRSCYFAITQQPEWQTCDILCEKGGVWSNLTQGTTLTVVPNYGVDIIPTENGFRQLIGSEVLTVSSVATGLATIPPGANLAEIHVLDNPVVSRLDGTPPTGNGATPVGRRAEDGAYFELEERDEINNFSVVRLNGNPGSDARLYVEYFFQCGSKDLNN